MAEQVLVIDPRDNVAVALQDLAPGQRCEVHVGGDTQEVILAEKIPFGHKFALRRIARGENVLKYGEVIGEATADIEIGAWVHVHNVVSQRGRRRSSEEAA